MQPVVFIGAGPGNAELLTLKGARLLQTAEVCLYDALIEFESFDTLLPQDCLRIPVGKRCGAHSKTQDEICELIIHYALSGKKTIRLKGGDPALFGRLGEELLALHRAGIPWEIIPGVSSMNAAAADFSLPLTLRGVSDCICLISGHDLVRKPAETLEKLAHYPGTIVIFMGAKRRREICQTLLAYGADGNKPVRLIENAGRKTARSTLWTLGEAAVDESLLESDAPALLLIGNSLLNEWDALLKSTPTELSFVH